jgi:hypothetical protein
VHESGGKGQKGGFQESLDEGSEGLGINNNNNSSHANSLNISKFSDTSHHNKNSDSQVPQTVHEEKLEGTIDANTGEIKSG